MSRFRSSSLMCLVLVSYFSYNLFAANSWEQKLESLADKLGGISISGQATYIQQTSSLNLQTGDLKDSDGADIGNLRLITTNLLLGASQLILIFRRIYPKIISF